MVYNSYLFRIWKKDYTNQEFTSIDRVFPGFQEMLTWANLRFAEIRNIECLERYPHRREQNCPSKIEIGVINDGRDYR